MMLRRLAQDWRQPLPAMDCELYLGGAAADVRADDDEAGGAGAGAGAGGGALLKVLSLNVYGVPVIAAHLSARAEALCALLRGDDGSQEEEGQEWDVVCLQEVWSCVERDALRTAGREGRLGLRYSRYWESGMGVFLAGEGNRGSGLMILSRFPIVETAFMPFSVSGKPYKVLHLDYHANKGLGLARLLTPAGVVDVYTTHLHAEYSRGAHDHDDGQHGHVQRRTTLNDEYEAHRISQAWEIAQFINMTQAPESVCAVLTGDINAGPDSLVARIIRECAGMTDTCVEWASRKSVSATAKNADLLRLHGPDVATSAACDNTFKHERDPPIRMDMILYRCRRPSVMPRARTPPAATVPHPQPQHTQQPDDADHEEHKRKRTSSASAAVVTADPEAETEEETELVPVGMGMGRTRSNPSPTTPRAAHNPPHHHCGKPAALGPNACAKVAVKTGQTTTVEQYRVFRNRVRISDEEVVSLSDHHGVQVHFRLPTAHALHDERRVAVKHGHGSASTLVGLGVSAPAASASTVTLCSTLEQQLGSSGTSSNGNESGSGEYELVSAPLVCFDDQASGGSESGDSSIVERGERAGDADDDDEEEEEEDDDDGASDAGSRTAAPMHTPPAACQDVETTIPSSSLGEQRELLRDAQHILHLGVADAQRRQHQQARWSAAFAALAVLVGCAATYLTGDTLDVSASMSWSPRLFGASLANVLGIMLCTAISLCCTLLAITTTRAEITNLREIHARVRNRTELLSYVLSPSSPST